jgi:hypothetical protein
MRPCRRPNDFVIKRQLSDGEVVYNLVPAGKQHRFRAAAQPTPCEIVNED